MEEWLNAAQWTWVTYLVFGFFSLGTLGGALYLFFTKNILYGAYGLLTSLISIAGLFLVAGAEFIAVSQIMIYVGGILILILFGIMLSAKGKDRRDALGVKNVNNLASLLIAALVAGGIILYGFRLQWPAVKGVDQEINQVRNLGMSLMTTEVLMLEMAGVLLLLVLIGASYIAKK